MKVLPGSLCVVCVIEVKLLRLMHETIIVVVHLYDFRVVRNDGSGFIGPRKFLLFTPKLLGW